MKWQMEDLAFRYLNPVEYRQISQALKMRRPDREVFMRNLIQRLHEMLEKAGVNNVRNIRARQTYLQYSP